MLAEPKHVRPGDVERPCRRLTSSFTLQDEGSPLQRTHVNSAVDRYHLCILKITLVGISRTRPVKALAAQSALV